MRRIAWVFGLLGVSIAGYASAQGQARPAPVAATAASLKLRSVAVPPALKSALTSKKKVAPATVAQYVSYAGKTPFIRTKSGRQYALEPVDAPEPTSAESKPTPIPASMQKYTSYINAFKYGPPSKTGPIAVATTTDHREKQSPIKDQGKRGTCVAFASVAALEAGYRRRGLDVDISENHAYNVFMPHVGDTCHDDKGVKTYKAAGWLTGGKVCSESKSPYISDEKAPDTDCSIVQDACKNDRRYGFDATIPLFGQAGGAGQLSINNTNYLEAFLDMGFDIVGGFWLTGTDWSDGTAENGIIDVQTDAYGNPLGGSGGHAMLIVGYNHTLNYFILKNSYGTDFGHAGYAFVSYEYMQTYAKYGYVVTSVFSDRPQVMNGSGPGANVTAAGGGPTPVRVPAPPIRK